MPACHCWWRRGPCSPFMLLVAHLRGGRNGQGSQTWLLALDQDEGAQFGRLFVAEWLWDFLHWFLADRDGAGIYRTAGGTSSQGFLSRRISRNSETIRN